MDRTSIDTMPPIPTRTHRVHSSQRSRISSTPTSAARKRYAIPPGSPEIISSLIQSLSAIAEPANHHFDNGLVPTNLSLPTSPNPRPHSSSRRGSDHAGPVSLDDLAASPPVIRTAKPPSGFSPLTAPQSPRSHRSTSRESGFRSFIRSAATSRPSSTGSFASKNDDARSIGNLSVERGSAPHPELRPRRSLDSWGKKSSRGSKVLSYMGSKEHLREPQIDRRRASSTPIVGGSSAAAGGSIHSASKTDNFFAGGAINEEPAPITTDDSLLGDGLHHIPVRDSSLRNSSSSRKRASTRRSMKEGEASISDKIVETSESGYGRDFSKMKHRRSDSDTGKTFLYDVEEIAPPKLRTKASSTYLSVDYIAEERPDELEDDGAPFPSVSQGRRRDELDRKDHRLSTRTHPGPNEGLRLKRSSSRLKRLSAPLTPQENKRPEEPAQSVKPTGYERPQSADSIDDAVESYLCSPRLSQKIRHPQTGRIISFSEVGDPEGFAVFCCVGMGLTRYITAFYDELALTLRLRLITPDRPGVGDSEPYTDGTSTPLSWPDDVYAICQTLKITKFSLMAHSAGAIYALATALRMPQHIRGKIHLLAPWIPPSQMNVFGSSQANPPSHTLPTAQRILRVLPTSFLKAANSSFMSATSSSITSSLPKNPRRTKRKTGQKDGNSRNATPSTDKENANQAADGKDSNGTLVNDGDLAATNGADGLDKALPQVPAGSDAPPVMDPLAEKERQQTYDIRLTHAIWELATTNANPAVDLLICLERRHTIGFRYVDITRPVIIRHGSRDTRVPVENVKWLGKTMRRCEVRVLEGEGHGLMASATVMGSVLMEISREWEDSVKAAASEGKERERGRRGAPSK
ncbi:alpha/beta hydrolase fold domain-containing protein [Trichoderma breve]|uniref:Alpha/beta hydrolase fold domain-containing protein n=1 Tax=Trichoderma breve TaxID=2034170 RepID=A0A9W9E2X6_9HYPO|nr:alpha/beta hydrolase fold domain-containing protein [Trichoderma breve]KAJ4855979.1 alpha/beta hydrolase fold domain-containing protein [Trichoderma breve]